MRSTSSSNRRPSPSPSSAGSSVSSGSSRRPTSPRWCEPRWSGASATRRRRPASRSRRRSTAGLQAAANRAMRDNLTAYDERHGYRGPLARVELPAGAANAAAPLELTEVDAEALRALLDDYPALLDYESAIVLGADDVGARVFFADHGEEAIALDAVEWACAVRHRRHPGRKADDGRRGVEARRRRAFPAARRKADGGSRSFPKRKVRSSRSIRSTEPSSR